MSNWIFLRGWGRGVGHWADFPDKVAAAFPDDEVEFLELPGNGQRFQEVSPISVSETVDLVRKQSDFIRKNLKVRLVGMSLGGMVAAEWARRFPEEIELLGIINSSASNTGAFYERLRTQNVTKILRIIQDKTVEGREQKILEMVSNSSDRRQEVLASWICESKTHPVSAKNHARQLMAASRFQFAKKAPVKTALFGSAEDRLVSVHCTETLAEKWKCPLFLHPWAGHDLPLDDPEWLLSCLKKVQ